MATIMNPRYAFLKLKAIGNSDGRELWDIDEKSILSGQNNHIEL